MGTKKIVDFEQNDVGTSGFWGDLSNTTQTLDLSNLLSTDLTSSGSFDVRSVQSTSLGKLLNVLPIPAFLVSDSYSTVFANDASSIIVPYADGVVLDNVSQLFRHAKDAEEARDIVDTVFARRKHLVREALLGSGGNQIWGRVHFRSLRMGEKRYALLLVEDLTLEKKQVLLGKKYSAKIKEAHDQLEARVEERTAELAHANELLKCEIEERKHAQGRLDLAAKVIASSNEAILITDPEARIVDVNAAFCEITGYSKEEVVQRNPSMMASGRHDREFWKDFWQSLQRTGKWKGEVWDRRKDGEIFPKLLSVSAVKTENGEVSHYVGIFSDITRQKHTEARLEHMAHFDPLTMLPNRVLFRDRLRRAMARAERTNQPVGLIFLDLDGFKFVNDTLGHPVGDRFLVSVGERLANNVRKSDTVARLGGDEFTLVVSDFQDISNLTHIAQKIIDLFAKPFEVDDHKFVLTASLGIALYPQDGQDVDQLIQHADTAMYYVKERGKNRFQYFSQKMNEAVSKRLRMETLLREALEREQFRLFYQPQFDISSGRVVGSEALIRWTHPELGRVSPDEFIPLAEAIGLIHPLGDWVVLTACRQQSDWMQEGITPLTVAVNISGHQIKGDKTLQAISRVLRETGLDPGLLEFEITESALMEDADEVIQTLLGLKDMGVGLAIDDFGTGYSSLNHLKRFPADKLKIDCSFVSDIGQDPDNESIIKTIIAIGHSLRMKVLAEGVETKEQFEFLNENGCDEIQGYYLGKPSPADQFCSLFLK